MGIITNVQVSKPLEQNLVARLWFIHKVRTQPFSFQMQTNIVELIQALRLFFNQANEDFMEQEPITENVWWIIPNKLAGVRKPMADELSTLQKAGIGAIVSVMDDRSNLDLYQQENIPHLWLPVKGGTPPYNVQVQQFCRFVEKHNSTGVAVHCTSGKRRTGTLLAAYLIKQGQSYESAIQTIQTAKPDADPRDAQRNFLKALAMNVTVIGHPLVQHKLTLMRDKNTKSHYFRQLLREISMLLAYEVTHDFPLTYKEIETPLAKMQAPKLDGKKVVLVSILRAGNGILEGMLDLIPAARVGHIGIYRDPQTLDAVQYYFKMPAEVEDRNMIVVDPMLATGNSAIAAVTRLKQVRPKSIKFVCLLAAPEGIEAFYNHHPDVPIYTGAIDQKLNGKGYIIPGLGDAGDRIYGTK